MQLFVYRVSAGEGLRLGIKVIGKKARRNSLDQQKNQQAREEFSS